MSEARLTEAPADDGGDDGVELELGEELVAEVERKGEGKTDNHGLRGAESQVEHFCARTEYQLTRGIMK